MRMRFKPYAHDELMAADFHVGWSSLQQLQNLRFREEAKVDGDVELIQDD